MSYTMECNGMVVCEAESSHCFVDREGRIVRAKRDYPEFYSTLEGLLQEQNDATNDAHLNKLTEKAGIANFSMHTLRHTFATRCIEAGMRPKTLQNILGHSSINITMNLYVHVTDEASKEEMDKFAKYDRALA